MIIILEICIYPCVPDGQGIRRGQNTRDLVMTSLLKLSELFSRVDMSIVVLGCLQEVFSVQFPGLLCCGSRGNR